MTAEVRAADGFALSPYQRRLHRVQAAGSPANYRARCVIEVAGDCDTARLEGALARIVRRHEILRTRFERVAGMTLQVILPDLEPRVEHIHESGDATPTVLLARAAERFGRPALDATQSPGLQVWLITRVRDRHAIVVDVPTLCADSRSLDRLVHELAAAYSTDPVEADTPPPLQYADFSEWQNQALEEVAADARDYWQAQWDADRPVVQLPGLTPDAERTSFAPRCVSRQSRPELATALGALASAHGCSIDVAVLTGWFLLLWRLGRQDAVVMGLTCEGRSQALLEDSLGLFATCVPVKQRFRRGATFLESLQRIRDAVQDAEAWQPTFAWDLVERPGQTPTFVQFAFEKVSPPQTVPAGDVTFMIAARDVFVERFDLRLRCAAAAFTLDYDTAVCGAAAASRVLAQLEQLLVSATRDPSCAIERLNLVGPDERRVLVEDWNRTRVAYDDAACMHELFEAQAARTPANLAVVCGERSLTYRQLDVRASRIARSLRARGVRPESLVAVCAGRSPELIAGLLGVLKAGGAFLPVDPTYPPARIEFMLEDSGAGVALTDAATAALLVCVPLPTVRLDEEEDAGPDIAHEHWRRPDADDLAYVIYTSGSTGMPKGASIPHRGLVNYLTWCRRAYPIAGGSGALVHSSISFDLTITGLLAPLLTGSTVRLLPEGRDVGALGDALAQEDGLSFLKLTPSHLKLIGGQLEVRALDGRVHALIIGGENLTAGDVAEWRAHAPSTRLFNEYGPTETVVGCCVYEIGSDTPRSGSIPIGRPIANTTAYVLDELMQLVPAGVPGELYIGGDGVGRGYLRRPALTAARFVPDPFSPAAGRRLYRTGDLVRYAGDGTLHFLGRIDRQVKVRGMRIELQEIEAVLCQHPNVRAATVTLRSRGGDDARLIAYVVPRDAAAERERDALVDRVSAFVRQVLPDHMAPAAYVVVRALPLTANGKINHDALPDPDADAAVVRPPYVAPRTAPEQLLAEVWHDALRTSRIGIDDDFFALGGNSLLCFQIIHRLHQAGYRLTLQQIFTHHSIRALAPVLERLPDAAPEWEPVTGPVPLTPIQRWFFEHAPPNPDRYTQGVLLDIDDRLEPRLLEQALGHVLARHDALRARFVADERGWNQRIDASADPPPVAVVDGTGLAPAELRIAIGEATRALHASLSLTHGPLARLTVVDCGPSEPTRLMIACHHIAADAVSWRVLIEDLYAAYEQLRQGAPVRLVATLPFARWAQHLDAHAETAALAAEARHWLADDAAVVRLPRDRDDGPNVVSAAASVTVTLNEDDTRALVGDVPAAFGTGINDALLTAVARAICAWTNHPSVRVDVESHGRDATAADLDVSRTIGWFTAMYPVTLSPGSSVGIAEALREVSAQLARVPNGGVGYGLLRYLGRDAALVERLRRLPQAEISFNYLGSVDAPLSHPGITVAAEHPTAGIDERMVRPHSIELAGEVSADRLHLHWTYSRHWHSASTIERVARHVVDELRALVAEAVRVHTRATAASSPQPCAAPVSLADRVLVRLQPLGSKRPLFLAHPSGGMSTVYADVVRHMGGERPVYGFQSRGWYPGEEPETDLTAMAASYVDVMRTVQPVGPYLLAGWSAGAIVAFEMGLQLQRRGEAVAFLGVIDQMPPQPDAVWQTDDMLLEAMLGHHIPEFAERASRMSGDARLLYALEEAKKLRFVPEQTELSQARRLLHVFRITQMAVRAYVPSVYEGSLVLFRAMQQPAAASWAGQPTFGWDRYVTGRVEVHHVPGHHQNVLEEPGARVLGECLRSSIGEAEASYEGHRRSTAPVA